MYVCQWHLDIPYGKLGDAIQVMKAWGAEKMASSEFKRASAVRLLSGHIGVSASHMVDEYTFASLADFEAALGGMGQPQFKPHSDALAPLIVPGTQEWKVWKVVP
jgi:hypothetical protein